MARGRKEEGEEGRGGGREGVAEGEGVVGSEWEAMRSGRNQIMLCRDLWRVRSAAA